MKTNYTSNIKQQSSVRLNNSTSTSRESYELQEIDLFPLRKDPTKHEHRNDQAFKVARGNMIHVMFVEFR